MAWTCRVASSSARASSRSATGSNWSARALRAPRFLWLTVPLCPTAQRTRHPTTTAAAGHDVAVELVVGFSSCCPPFYAMRSDAGLCDVPGLSVPVLEQGPLPEECRHRSIGDMATIPAARDLAVLSLDALLAEAAAVREAAFGRRITWSPSVLI